MAKKKNPARKSVVKKGAPAKKGAKKAPVCKKPIPQQVIDRSVAARGRAGTQTTKIQEGGHMPQVDGFNVDPSLLKQALDAPLSLEPIPVPPPAPRYPAPKPPTKKSKFWRQYQDTETGEFIGWTEVLKRTGVAVVSRLRLRKPQEKAAK